MQENERKDESQFQEQVIYRWDYGAQIAYDSAEKRKQKRKGVLIYAVVMTLFFALCLGALTVTLLWNGKGSSVATGNALTTVEVAEFVNPSTVLIYASTSTSYGYGTGFFIRENGYIETDKDGHISLLPTGRAIAESIMERHTIISGWLISMGVPEDIASEDACKIEHVISDETFNAIKRKLGGDTV